MEKKKIFIINTLYFAIILAILYVVLHYLAPVLTPFIVAFFVAAILVKLSRWLAKKLHISAKLLSLLLIAASYALFFWAVITGGANLFTAARKFLMGLPDLYVNQILPTLTALFEKLEDMMSEADPAIVEQVESWFNDLTGSLGQLFSNASVSIVKTISGYVTGIPSLIVKVVVTVVSTFFIAMDYDRVIGLFVRLLPPKWTEFIINIKNYTIHVVFAYVRTYLLLMLITFGELTIGLLILRIPYAVWIALIIAIFDMMPILGTGGILLPWAAIAAILGYYSMAICILLLYLIITAIRNTLEPRIVGKQIGLPPLVTLIALFAGMSLFGLVGLIGFPVCLSALFNMEQNGVIHIFGKRDGGQEDASGQANAAGRKNAAGKKNAKA